MIGCEFLNKSFYWCTPALKVNRETVMERNNTVTYGVNYRHRDTAFFYGTPFTRQQ